MPKVDPEVEAFARIKVIGVGGSGNNAVNHMIEAKVKGVEFIVMNTDAQDLHHSLAKKKIHIGKNLTRGLGTGMNPELGKRAAEETKEEVQDVIKGSDMVFIACGMGGGTGTGASATIARIAREEGVLTVAVVTKPFFFEGKHRMKIADQGLAELKKEVDALIVIPNDKLLGIVKKETTFQEAFAICDEVLHQAVEGISDLITTPGIINVDFADIRAIMSNAGSALMGIGFGTGEKRAADAALAAINSPLLDISITGAQGVLFAIAGGDDLTMHEIQEAAKVITESVDPEARIIFGAIKDTKLKKDEVKVTVIASGFPDKELGTGASIFGTRPVEKKEEKIPTKETRQPEVREVRKEINNSIPNIPREQTQPQPHKPHIQQNTQPQTMQHPKDPLASLDDDDDDWNAIPAFLRRKK
jgi:cell division protein FtsZ